MEGSLKRNTSIDSRSQSPTRGGATATSKYSSPKKFVPDSFSLTARTSFKGYQTNPSSPSGQVITSFTNTKLPLTIKAAEDCPYNSSTAK
jgi:hypothetical protein